MQVNNHECCGSCASQSLLVRLLKGLTNYIVRSVLQQQEHNKSRCVNISLMSSIQNIHIHYVDSIIPIRHVQMVKFFVHIRCEVTFQSVIVNNRYRQSSYCFSGKNLQTYIHESGHIILHKI